MHILRIAGCRKLRSRHVGSSTCSVCCPSYLSCLWHPAYPKMLRRDGGTARGRSIILRPVIVWTVTGC